VGVNKIPISRICSTYKKELYERLTLIGPMDKRRDVINALLKAGYNIKSLGPKPAKNHKVDTSKFKAVMERKI
jgi:hypothetical protein